MKTFIMNEEIYTQISSLEKYGLKSQTIINGMHRFRQGKSKHYINVSDPLDKRIKWILYRSIPLRMFEKYDLPSPSSLERINQNEEKESSDKLVKMTLDFAYDLEYKKFTKMFYGIFYERELIVQYAKTQSLFVSVLKLKQAGIPLNKILQVYQQFDFLKFETKSLKSFYAKLKDFERYGHRVFIHKSIGLTKSGTKVTEEHKEQIIKLYRNPLQHSGRVIHKKVNEWAIKNGYSQISISTIKQMMCDPVVQNKCKPFRNGKEWELLFKDPFTQRIDPDCNGQLWQLDGSRLQIPYLNVDRPGFLNLFVVMDVHSRKIVGYSSDVSENHKMVIAAIKDAVEKTNYLPVQIVIDNGSCFKKDRFVKLEEHMALLGTEVRRHKVGLARDKGHVERFFSTFQTTVCKYADGYIGEGVKSRREEGRPSKEIVKKALSRKNLRTKVELEKLLDELIEIYNKQQLNSDLPSPNLRFDIAKIDKDVVYVPEHEFALMFWDKTSIKIRNSMVVINEVKSRKKRYQYVIHDKELRLSLNLTSVKVCFTKEDRSRIKLFDENQEWITDLELDKPIKSIFKRKQKSSIRPKYNFKPNGEQSVENKVKKRKRNKDNQLFKKPASLDVILVKTKGDE